MFENETKSCRIFILKEKETSIKILNEKSFSPPSLLNFNSTI